MGLNVLVVDDSAVMRALEDLYIFRDRTEEAEMVRSLRELLEMDLDLPEVE